MFFSHANRVALSRKSCRRDANHVGGTQIVSQGRKSCRRDANRVATSFKKIVVIY